MSVLSMMGTIMARLGADCKSTLAAVSVGDCLIGMSGQHP